MFRIVSALAAALLGGGVALTAQAARPDVSAAFLFNVVRFTEWTGRPAKAGPLSLCVVGNDEVEHALRDLLSSGAIHGRPAMVQSSSSDGELRACHVVYLGNPATERAAEILEALQGAPVLTVGPGSGFLRSGGMVELFLEAGRLRFAINPDTAQRAGVRISSRLLQLARIVQDPTSVKGAIP